MVVCVYFLGWEGVENLGCISCAGFFIKNYKRRDELCLLSFCN